MMIKLGIAALAAGLFAVAPLHAQHTHGQHRQQAQPAQQQAHEHGAEGGMHCPMHAEKHGVEGEHASHASDPVHRYAPKMLLQHREMLNLTAAQAERLEALQAAHKADCHARMERVKAAEQAALAALAGATPDVATFEAKSREAANLKVDCKVDMVKTGQEALTVLTAEQRAHLAHMGHTGH
jgi:Spy/CpxP family protein refolding chaperone